MPHFALLVHTAFAFSTKLTLSQSLHLLAFLLFSAWHTGQGGLARDSVDISLMARVNSPQAQIFKNRISLSFPYWVWGWGVGMSGGENIAGEISCSWHTKSFVWGLLPVTENASLHEHGSAAFCHGLPQELGGSSQLHTEMPPVVPNLQTATVFSKKPTYRRTRAIPHLSS